MKKVRIMLMSLLLLAVVGGALAFKVKFDVEYCTAAATNGTCPSGKLCPNYAIDKTISDGGTLCTVAPRAGAAAGKECKTSDAAGAADKACVVNTTTAYVLDDNN